MNIRRTVSLGLLMLIMVISGCAGTTPTEKTKMLTLWYWNRSLDDDLIKAAEQQFPGIRIDAQKSEAISNPSSKQRSLPVREDRILSPLMTGLPSCLQAPTASMTCMIWERSKSSRTSWNGSGGSA